MATHVSRTREINVDITQRRKEDAVASPYVKLFAGWHERSARMRVVLDRDRTSSAEHSRIQEELDVLMDEVRRQRDAFALAAASFALSGRILDVERAFGALLADLEQTRSICLPPPVPGIPTPSRGSDGSGSSRRQS